MSIERCRETEDELRKWNARQRRISIIAWSIFTLGLIVFLVLIGGQTFASTNRIPVDLEPGGYDGIGIRGPWVNEALNCFVGYPMALSALSAAERLLDAKDFRISNLQAGEEIMVSNNYALKLKAENDRRIWAAEIKRGRAKAWAQGAIAAGLTLIGGIVGWAVSSNAQGVAVGAAVGAGAGAGAFILIEARF